MYKITSFIVFFALMINLIHSQHCKDAKCGHRNHFLQKSSTIDNKRSDTIDVKNYQIYLDFTQASNQQIKGACQVKFQSKMNGVSTISLDLLQLAVDSIEQQALDNVYTYNDTLLVIQLKNTLNIGEEDSLTVYYHGTPKGDASGWGGFYFQGNYSYNLGVGFAANPHNYGRVWHPCFDNFVERATYDISILSLGNQKGYANGLLVGESNSGIGILRTWKLTQEIPTYLACVSVGDYTHVNQTYFSALQTKNIPVNLISVPSDTNNFKASFVHLFGAMNTFENKYGPYLWDKVGFHLVPFSSGAMEHATSIAYPQYSVNGSTTFETLMAHELSHHWWGNLVTCRTAEDMWINEGMASYSERIFLEQQYGYEAYIKDIKLNHKEVLLNAHIRDSGYYALHGVPHDITYGDHSYNKGADVAHTMRSYLGDSLFFGGIQSFLDDNTFADVNADDFRTHLNQSNNSVDMTDFFNDWIFQAGFPGFILDSFQLANTTSTYQITLNIQQKLKGTNHLFSNVPIEVTFVKNDWSTETKTIYVSGANSQVTITVSFNPVFIYLNGGDKISQAVTGENNVVKTTGSKDLTYPMFRYTVSNPGQDSSLLRIEHYWVAPDDFKEPQSQWRYHISNERFWKVDGIFSNGFAAEARVFFNARTNINGNLDNVLCSKVGFNEDSLKILFRKDARDDWREISGATSSLGSKTDGYGYITIDSLKKGEYTFGWRKSPLGITESQKEYFEMNVFPNPTQDWLTVVADVQYGKEYIVEIYDALGKKILSKDYFASKIDVKNLPKGIYSIHIRSVYDPQIVVSRKFIKE